MPVRSTRRLRCCCQRARPLPDRYYLRTASVRRGRKLADDGNIRRPFGQIELVKTETMRSYGKRRFRFEDALVMLFSRKLLHLLRPRIVAGHNPSDADQNEREEEPEHDMALALRLWCSFRFCGSASAGCGFRRRVHRLAALQAELRVLRQRGAAFAASQIRKWNVR